MTVRKFEDLRIWQLSIKITKNIYDITSTGMFVKDMALTNQLRRAVISISSNIAEGFEKNNNNEFIRFLRIAKGSTGEIKNQLWIALSIKYITKEEFDVLGKDMNDLIKQIGGLLSYLTKAKRLNSLTNKLNS